VWDRLHGTIRTHRAVRETGLPAYRDPRDLAGLKSGDSVLDVGCGTGALAMAAKQRVGASGKVHGIDASPEMIARARKKANKRGSDVGFRTAVVEELPFPDETFDAVLSTLMLHHLPGARRHVRIWGVR
jgi:ubiquinone/menaquinone biosynthesis C-methylase UbiE